MPNGPMRITSGPFEPDLYKSEMEVQDAELKVSMRWKVVSTWHLSSEWGLNVSKVLKRSTILRVRLFYTFLKICFSSFSYFPGPPAEFCKSENPEKEKKEGLLQSSFFSGWTWSFFIPLFWVVAGYRFLCLYFPPSQLWRRELGDICPWSPTNCSKVLETDKSSPSFYEYRPLRLQRMPPVAKH